MGGLAHKFSSGSYTEGRLAAKAAVAYVSDGPGARSADLGRVEAIKKDLFRPLEVYEKAQPLVARGDVNPRVINPKQALLSL